MPVESYIKENATKLSSKVHIAPDIPEKKLNGAINTMSGGQVDPDYVLAIVDTSLFGSGKDGCIFTGDSIYIHALLRNKIRIKFEEMNEVEYVIEETVTDKDEVKETEHFYITLENGDRIDLSNDLPSIDMSVLKEILLFIINGKDKHISFENTAQGNMRNENQSSPLADMPERIKIAYMELIINGIFEAEFNLESTIYSEIISLIVSNRLDKDSRIQLRHYLFEGNSIVSNSQLLTFLKAELSENDFINVKFSLLKDLLSIHRALSADKDKTWTEYPTIQKMAETLDIEHEQVDEIEASLINSEDILKNRQNDDQIKKTLTDMGARAASVGVPLAALYFSGTMGVSAVGITSGLATIGMKGFLGLSPMMAGIGALILVGVGTYSGLKKLTGISELENNKTREVMLTEIIKNSQTSLNILIEDINEISTRLTKAVSEGIKNQKQIVEISETLNMLARNTKTLTDKLDKAERENALLTLPLKLDILRVEELTNQPTERKYYDAIMEAYTEKSVVIEKKVRDDSTGATKIVTEERVEYLVREDLSLEELNSLTIIFETIGYHKVTDATIASAKGKTKEFFSRFGEES